MEKRKPTNAKFSELPLDYARMVDGVFTANFDPGLKALKKLDPARARFATAGRIYPDEILVSVSLMQEGRMSATSVHASCDYDPKASSPTIQELLGACVDAVGAIYGQLLAPDRPEVLEQVSHESLSALEDIPFEWTAVKVEKHQIFLKVDKSNPELDRMADAWLDRHDPERAASSEEEERQTEGLFVTGPKSPKGRGSSSKH